MKSYSENNMFQEHIGKGESKIEKGLREFRIYRAAPNNKLLHLQPAELDGDFRYRHSFRKLFNRAIFFTTQKGMAMEYRGVEPESEKTVLLEQRGVHFLSDLQKLEEQGIKIVLFSHENLIAYNKMLGMKDSEENEEIENFLAKRTFLPSEVSPRMLRRSAEVVVLMPEHLNDLPLNTKTFKKHNIKNFDLKKKKAYSPGAFHQKLVEVNERPNVQLRRLKRKLKRLERKRGRAFGETIEGKYSFSDKEEAMKKIKLIDKEIKDLKNEISKQDVSSL